MKHKNTQTLYIFNRENPQNSEPQNGPRSGLDYIALGETYYIQFPAYGGKASQGDGEYSQGTSHCRMSPLTVMPIAIG